MKKINILLLALSIYLFANVAAQQDYDYETSEKAKDGFKNELVIELSNIVIDVIKKKFQENPEGQIEQETGTLDKYNVEITKLLDLVKDKVFEQVGKVGGFNSGVKLTGVTYFFILPFAIFFYLKN